MKDKMSWDEAVEWLRSPLGNPQIAADAYLEKDLVRNIERFRISKEYTETINLLKSYCNNTRPTLLDIGAGNGISSIAFALEGYQVTSLEPYPSESVGSGAIRWLVEHYKLSNVLVVEAFGENLPFDKQAFDIVYGRQVMHHAHDLNKFIAETARVLKQGGMLFTVRDHVIRNGTDKQRFLEKHPLHHLYGGENAFKIEEYCDAITLAGLKIKKMISPSESPINYEPWNKEKVKKILEKRLGNSIGGIMLFTSIAWSLLKIRLDRMPGKMYSFIAIKE